MPAAEQLCGESCKDMEYSSRTVTRTGHFVHKFQEHVAQLLHESHRNNL